jgi:hypothetical protein
MKTFRAVPLLFVLVVLCLNALPIHAATASYMHPSHSLSGCYYTSCDGKLENGVSPPCSNNQIQSKGDWVYDDKGNIVGIIYVFVGLDCNSDWGGFNAHLNGLQSIELLVGNYNLADEGGPIYSLNTGQWGSSYMDEKDQHCISAWIYGYSSITNARFSHKIIVGGVGC